MAANGKNKIPGDRLKVATTATLPAAIEERLSALFDTTIYKGDARLTPAQLINVAKECDVIVTNLTDTLDENFFGACGDRLKLVANFGAGVDHIDVAAAAKRDVIVTNTPSVLAEDAADMAMALIIAVPRRLFEGARTIEQKSFKGWSPTWMLGSRIRGKKLGIVGLGRVGQAIAHRARAFGISIHYHNRSRINPHVEEQLGATYWESLDQMLANVDIVSVNCPHTPATYHLLSRRRLGLLQPHAYVVNVSRGEIIDEEALAAMIAEKRLAGAALDVFENEPEPNPALLNSPDVVLLPHMASATRESRLEMGERVIINIKMFADGHKPPDRIILALA